MAHVALYRKYRSTSFAEVIGQDHITRTLTAALQHGHISHAYLFTGPRGTGKTTVARLLAKGIICEGADPKPCGTCRFCTLAPEANLDIIEIDGASNRGIDDARELRDKVHVAPTQAAYKIYIIDEVHMLTKEAFNALLKTLEEPPSHVVFILATTEAHKLPETIVSRTQRFSFHTITEADLRQGLLAIAKKEGFTLEKDAAATLATASRGGFRDALSLLDQARGGEATVTNAGVLELLGWAEAGQLETLLTSAFAGRQAATLEQLAGLVASGAQLEQLPHQLLLRLRQALRQADNVPWGATTDTLLHAIDILLRLPTGLHTDIALEVALLQFSRPTVATQAAPAPAQTAAPSAARSTATQATTPAPAKPAGTPLDTSLWPKALLEIKAKNNSLYALLQSCHIEFNSDSITVHARFGFHRDRIREQKNSQIIEKALAQVYNQAIRVDCELQPAGPVPATAASAELVTSALEILGGEIVDE